MPGFAQQLFAQRYSKPLVNEDIALSAVSAWPSIDKMLSVQCLGQVDVALAKALMQKVGISDEASAVLICHLSMATRQGHLCVSLENNKISPAVEDVWIPPEQESMGNESLPLPSIENLIKVALQNKSTLISDGSQADNLTLPIVQWENKYYLQRLWVLESEIVKFLPNLLKTVPVLQVDAQAVEQRVKDLLSAQKILPEQAQAILASYKSCLNIITGGPGTGKTYTAGVLLRVLWESLSASDQAACRIVLAAPTGKAASNLQSSMSKATSHIQGFPKITAQTIHKLLGIGRNSHRTAVRVLEADIVLIDESSMIDAQLMARLLCSLKPGTCLIFLGDAHQLPAIEGGAIFADLVELFRLHPLFHAHLTELKTCMRAELHAIVSLAQVIKEGNYEAIKQIQQSDLEKSLRFTSLEALKTPKDFQRVIINEALRMFPLVTTEPQDPAALLNEFLRFRMLSPLRKGALGSVELNAIIYQSKASKSSHAECFVAPIMITKNDYSADLFNGEMGLLVKFKDSSKDYALFSPKLESDPMRKVAYLRLPAFEYAYCISIHKSQGSEFAQVLVLLPEGSEIFGREALYTAVTRAKKALNIWVAPSTLQRMVQKCNKRQSGIIARLKSHLGNSFEGKLCESFRG